MIRTFLAALALLVVAAVPALASPPAPLPTGAFPTACAASDAIGTTCTGAQWKKGYVVTYLSGGRMIHYALMTGAGTNSGGVKRLLLSDTFAAQGNYCIEGKGEIALFGQTAHRVEPATPCAE